MIYAHKKYVVSVVKLDEDVRLDTMNGTKWGAKGELLVTDQLGNKDFLTQSYFDEYYIGVEKVDDVGRAYAEMGSINLEEANEGVHTYYEGKYKI